MPGGMALEYLQFLWWEDYFPLKFPPMVGDATIVVVTI